MQESKIIWTFWEPKEKIPAYLKLCMKTWQKFLPEYKVIIVDYENLEQYLGKNFFDPILYQKFSLPKQADAIRCALLEKYGGIWLDCDTIIVSDKIRDILSIDSSFVLIGAHVAFIKTSQDSPILKQWLKNIQKNILFYKKYQPQMSFFLKIWLFFKYFPKYKKMVRKRENWDFIGNFPLGCALKKYKKDKRFFSSVDRSLILPEVMMYEILSQETYRRFYFEDNFGIQVLNNNNGLILLHNSWTPEKYLLMDEKQFLKQNNTLAYVLGKLNGSITNKTE